MDRRQFVRLGVGSGVASLAGCLGTLSDSSKQEGEGESSFDEPGESDGMTGPDGTGAAALERIPVGDGDVDEASILSVRNDGEDERTVAVRIRRDGTTVLERSDDVPPEEAIAFLLTEPGTYETALETGSMYNRTVVEHAPTDCGRARTVVSLTESGISTRTATGCEP